jgi:ribulose 1,5-bisphosphate synthetase/thiazole synthase
MDEFALLLGDAVDTLDELREVADLLAAGRRVAVKDALERLGATFSAMVLKH